MCNIFMTKLIKHVLNVAEFAFETIFPSFFNLVIVIS